MATSAKLLVQLRDAYVLLEECISFRFEKERYLPSTKLSGKWYCKDVEIDEILSLSLMLDGYFVHFGYPSAGTQTLVENGRCVLRVNSRGYSQALAQNQPTPGLVTSVNLESIANSAIICPNVSYEQNSPAVRYVNYYDGTSIWDAIVCYCVRATGTYPYIRGINTVNISAIPSDVGALIVTPEHIVSSGAGSDFTNLISEISEISYTGEYGGYHILNQAAIDRSIIRKKEIPFDHEWVMDPDLGLATRVNYSMRRMNYRKFKIHGYYGGDLLDNFIVSYENPYVSRISRIIVEGKNGDVFTTVYCYSDAYCG